MPLVSVLVIAGTGRPYLIRALCSLVVQDMTDWEAVVLDACHDPADSARVREQLREVVDDRVRAVRYDRDTVAFPPYASRKWNFALQHARGQFVGFLDDDDEKDGGWLSAMVAPLRDERVAASVCDGTCIDGDGVRSGTVFGVASLDRATLLRANFVTTGQLLVRRSVIDAIGGFDEDLGCAEDYDFCIRLSAHPWQRCSTRALKRNTSSNASHHPDVTSHTQVALRRTLAKHGAIDDRCSRCRGLMEAYPDHVAAGGWHWRVGFNRSRLAWEIFCGMPPGNCA